MLKALALAATLASSTVFAGPASNNSGPFAVCQLATLTFAEVQFGNNQVTQAQNECNRLLQILNNDQATCNVVRVNVNGQNVLRARLRLDNLINAANLNNALLQLQQLIQGAGLLGDRNLGLQLTTNGNCQ